MLTPHAEEEGQPRIEPLSEPPRLESEFFVQLQELRDRIREWEARNGEDASRNRPS